MVQKMLTPGERQFREEFMEKFPIGGECIVNFTDALFNKSVNVMGSWNNEDVGKHIQNESRRHARLLEVNFDDKYVLVTFGTERLKVYRPPGNFLEAVPK